MQRSNDIRCPRDFPERQPACPATPRETESAPPRPEFSITGDFRKRRFRWNTPCSQPSTSLPRRTMATAAEDVPTLSVTLLGAGQEVGRSCCVLQYRGKTVVCDAGVHPAYNGMASLPFVDELDWSTVDALLITQYAPSLQLPYFHADFCKFSP